MNNQTTDATQKMLAHRHHDGDDNVVAAELPPPSDYRNESICQVFAQYFKIGSKESAKLLADAVARIVLESGAKRIAVAHPQVREAIHVLCQEDPDAYQYIKRTYCDSKQKSRPSY